MTKTEMKEYVSQIIDSVENDIANAIDADDIPSQFDEPDLRYLISNTFARGIWRAVNSVRRREIIIDIIKDM